MTVCAVSKPNEKTPAPSEGTGAPRRGETLPLPRTRTVLRGASERLGRSSGLRRRTAPGRPEYRSLPAKRSQWLCRQGRPHSGGTARESHPLPYSPAQPCSPRAPNHFLSYLTLSKRALSMRLGKAGNIFCFFHAKRTAYIMHKKYTKFFLKTKRFVTRSSQIYATI